MKPHIKKVNGEWECNDGQYQGIGRSPIHALYCYCFNVELYPIAIVSDVAKVIDCWYKRGIRRKLKGA